MSTKRKFSPELKDSSSNGAVIDETIATATSEEKLWKRYGLEFDLNTDKDKLDSVWIVTAKRATQHTETEHGNSWRRLHRLFIRDMERLMRCIANASRSGDCSIPIVIRRPGTTIDVESKQAFEFIAKSAHQASEWFIGLCNRLGYRIRRSRCERPLAPKEAIEFDQECILYWTTLDELDERAAKKRKLYRPTPIEKATDAIVESLDDIFTAVNNVSSSIEGFTSNDADPDTSIIEEHLAAIAKNTVRQSSNGLVAHMPECPSTSSSSVDK